MDANGWVMPPKLTWRQIKQLAGERLGTAERTELPEEFLELERRLEQYKSLHLALLASLTPVKSLFSQQRPTFPTLPNSHPLYLLLHSISQNQIQLASLQHHFEGEVNKKVLVRLHHSLEAGLKHAELAVKEVRQIRIELDGVRNEIKWVKGEKLEELSSLLTKLLATYEASLQSALSALTTALLPDELCTTLLNYSQLQANHFHKGSVLIDESTEKTRARMESLGIQTSETLLDREDTFDAIRITQEGPIAQAHFDPSSNSVAPVSSLPGTYSPGMSPRSILEKNSASLISEFQDEEEHESSSSSPE